MATVWACGLVALAMLCLGGSAEYAVVEDVAPKSLRSTLQPPQVASFVSWIRAQKCARPLLQPVVAPRLTSRVKLRWVKAAAARPAPSAGAAAQSC